MEQFFAFELFAELGVGLAGFAGVVTAFSGRARVYDSTDKNRLLVLFICAGSVVAGSLAVIALLALGLKEATTYLVVSATLFFLFSAAAVPRLSTVWRNSRDPKILTPFRIFVAATAFVIVVDTLLVTNLFKGGKAGPLIAAFSLLLSYGLLVFTRLPTRTN